MHYEAKRNNSQMQVAMTLDRCTITSCTCTCAQRSEIADPMVFADDLAETRYFRRLNGDSGVSQMPSAWCSHVVAACLHRFIG